MNDQQLAGIAAFILGTTVSVWLCFLLAWFWEALSRTAGP